ncbi:MAG: hypothetical protein AAB365_00040 [Patescibacteria group bacterium]
MTKIFSPNSEILFSADQRESPFEMLLWMLMIAAVILIPSGCFSNTDPLARLGMILLGMSLVLTILQGFAALALYLGESLYEGVSHRWDALGKEEE